MSPAAHHGSPEPRASHATSRGARGNAPGGPARDRLTHLRQLVALIETAIDDPSLRASVPAWRTQARQAPAAFGEQADPIARRAFEAVLAGCDRLAADATDILATRDVPGREVATLVRRMRILLDRATALLDDGDAPAADAAARRIARLYAR